MIAYPIIGIWDAQKLCHLVTVSSLREHIAETISLKTKAA